MSKVIAYTIADDDNMGYAKGLKNSLKKTNPDLDFRIFGPHEIRQTEDQHIFYRATPYFALFLMQQGYDTVIKIDADSVVTSDISHVWEGNFDVATVYNSNPREMNKVVVGLQGIDPMEYQNCGFVVIKNIDFAKFWMALCLSGRFNKFQYREQDILNNIIYWGRFKVKFLDRDCGNKWHGLISKGYELNMIFKDGKLVLPQSEEWPLDAEKEIVCYHEAGGNTPNKLNFNVKFKPEVAKYLKSLVK